MRSRSRRLQALVAVLLALAGGPAAAQSVLNEYGIDPRTRVDIARAPWRSVGKLQTVVGGLRATCTGALVGPRTVLTAAHCLFNGPKRFLPTSMHFLIGYESGRYTAVSGVTNVLPAPDYEPMSGGEVQELGDFELDGVAFPAAEVQLEFLDPADDEGDGGHANGSTFPTGNHIDRLDVPGIGTIEATLINAGNPTAFVDAESLGLKGTELQPDVNGDKRLLARAETVRALATVAMGLAATPEETTSKRQHTPKLAFVAKPAGYTTSDGRRVEAGSIDLLARIFSMGVLHHAMTGTGAVAIAAAAAIPGTIVHRTAPVGGDGLVRFGHPSGTLKVGAEVERDGKRWRVTKVMMSRSARRLMEGFVRVPPAS